MTTTNLFLKYSIINKSLRSNDEELNAINTNYFSKVGMRESMDMGNRNML